jgi:hypothetical protein
MTKLLKGFGAALTRGGVTPQYVPCTSVVRCYVSRFCQTDPSCSAYGSGTYDLCDSHNGEICGGPYGECC